jgi:hypothetical protein
MNDIERQLDQLTPRPVRPNLRDQVLAAVETELSRAGQAHRSPTKTLETTASALNGRTSLSPGQRPGESSSVDSPWLRRATLVVAASLLLGIILNIWATTASERRLALLFGPPPISKPAMEIAKDVEKITDAATGQWVYARLTAPRQPTDISAANTRYRDAIKRLIDELQTVSKDSYHETPQKAPEMDSSHTRCPSGDRFDCQRRFRLDHRHTA